MISQKCNTEKIFDEYQKGVEFKSSLGSKGLYEQSKINERFFVGDQWYGANCGNDRPLVRHNVIKRIGDYKTGMIASSPISVNYTAEGVPNTLEIRDKNEKIIQEIKKGNKFGGFDEKIPANDEINLVMSALSDYFRVTAERIKFDQLKEQALRNGYISGTGIIYTYWNPDIKTGLYADYFHRKAITGDIECEVIDIENVYFGDPNECDIQRQPYIILAQRKSVSELREEAKKYGATEEKAELIKSDENRYYESGDYGDRELNGAEKTTVLTKFWKENVNGEVTVKAIRVCKGVVIRDEWNLKIRLYPFAKFVWERRQNNAYGESEITYLIPNQIAINRMLTANVWAVLMLGMPIMVVDGSVIDEPITNEPGQIITAFGNSDEVAGAIRYVTPPNFSPGFESNIASLIGNTLTQSGANDAALGDISPENTSAIIAVREAATMPLQGVQNRFYQFCEDIARIWAEFWISLYGNRQIKMVGNSNVWYFPFRGNRYRDLLVSARIDVGSSTLYGEAQTIKTLDRLYERQAINLLQYLKRLPKGVIPEISGLIKELEENNKNASNESFNVNELLESLTFEEKEIMKSLPLEQQQKILNNAMGGNMA